MALASATKGSLSWRSSQACDEGVRCLAVFSRCAAGAAGVAAAGRRAHHALARRLSLMSRPPLRPPPAASRAGGGRVGHQRQQQPFAQAAVGDPHPLARPDLLHRLQDRRAGQHQVGAVGADARLGGALADGQRQQPLAPPPRTRRGSSTGRRPWRGRSAAGRRCRPARLVIAPEVPIRWRLAGVEDARAAARRRRRRRSAPSPPRPWRGTRRRRPASALRKALGQGDHADRDREPGARSAAPVASGAATPGRLAQVEPGQLGRAAADVQHQRRVARRRSIRLRQPATDSCASSRGLMIVEPQAGALAHRGEELRPVLGRAAGLGGDGAQPHRRRGGGSCRRRRSERAERALHGRLAPAGRSGVSPSPRRTMRE